jgi:5,5'-dehydrodivanillate O-demethylase
MAQVTYRDFLSTAPGTLAGRYMRTFWQPVAVADELPVGRAKPIRIMNEDLTLYRGEDGAPHLVGFRCAHRGTQLSVGWVEGDCIRCLFHGWKYDSTGQCVEQPAEPEPFAEKIRVPGYPVREYIGLIFAYLGEGEPPEFPRYHRFEDPDAVLYAVAFHQPCNYYQNIDNSIDGTHVVWTHRRHRINAGDNRGGAGNPVMIVDENQWGVCHRSRFPNGQEAAFYFGMPNINYVYGQIVDPEFKTSENLIIKVPIDDENHFQFMVHILPVTGADGQRVLDRRRAQKAQDLSNHVDVARDIIAGKLTLDDVDPNSLNFVTLEDAVAQGAQGTMWEGRNEHLGRGDVGVILTRKLWERELRALAEGRPLTKWSYRPEMVPQDWREQTPRVAVGSAS